MRKIIAFNLFLLISNFLFSKDVISYNLSLETLKNKYIEQEYVHSSTQANTVTVNTVSDLNTIHSIHGKNITTVIVLGYHEKNDGGGGIFTFNSAKKSQNDGGLIFNGWERSITDSAINVKWFGAIATKKQIEKYTNTAIKANYPNIASIQTVNDLLNNNTLAFQKSLNAFLKSFRSHKLPGLYDRLSYSGIFIPSGEFLLKEDSLMTPNILSFRISGIKYFSDGQGVLTFIYSGKNKYAFNDLDHAMHVTFSDITFIGLSDDCNFLYSDSDGGGKDYYFERCNFFGNFNNIFTLRGTNTNSEWAFEKCTFLGKVNTILDIKESDQFLNYWFSHTKFWIEDGSIIKADKGGHFKFTDCDWSGYEPETESYYFELNGYYSSRGVNDFRIINGRFEMKNANARVLKTNWQHGNIEITADFGSQVYRDFFKNDMDKIKHFEFNFQGASNASYNSLNVKFRNSIMMGYHEFNYGNEAWRGTGRVSYENCSFPERNSLDNFIKINHNGNNNKSGIANIEIENAIFENNAGTTPNTPNDLYNLDFFKRPLYSNHYNLEIPSVSYLPSYSNRGLKKKYFKISHPATGVNPLENQKFILNFPKESEAIITSVKWFLSNKSSSSNKVVEFALSDLSGNIIISKIDPVQMRFGFDKKDDVYINVKNLEEGKLVLKDLRNNANQTANEFMCVIEYF